MNTKKKSEGEEKSRVTASAKVHGSPKPAMTLQKADQDQSSHKTYEKRRTTAQKTKA